MSLLGKGGMGEVWKAFDSRLGRDVALKFLPPEVTADAERLARFDREARILASLDDPRIAAIHGVEDSDGGRFLVMQLAEGEDLAVRLQRGAVPLDEALKMARQVAEALESAHEKGIVHRDLKPANIKVGPDGRVRILDFGLARALERDEPADDLSRSPTLLHGTGAGVILGTAGYMSPEQARGKRADRRSDLWAFGVVLWEMVTGRRLFAGETVSDALAAVLRGDPDWSALPAASPPALRRLLRRCLERDPHARLGDAGAARLEIDEAAAELARGGAGVSEAQPARVRARWIAVAAAIGVAAAGGVGWWLARARAPVLAPLRLEMSGVSFNSLSGVAVSPDGRRVAFVPYHPTAQGVLHVRALDEFTSHPVAGTEGAANPFFSPDGRSVAYCTPEGLYVVRLEGGVPRKIAPLVAAGESGVWTADGTIIFSGALVDGRRSRTLTRVPADGGPARPVSTLHGRDQQHRQPLVVGKWLIYATEGPGGQNLDVVSLVDGTRRELTGGFNASNPQYLPRSGHLLFFRTATLTVDAAPFDADTGQLVGEPVPVLPNVLRRDLNHGAFAVAPTGMLIYTPSDTSGAQTGAYSLVWVDRTGSVTPVIDRHDVWTEPRVSPDGRTILVRQTVTPDCVLWTIDIARRTVSRLTFKDDHHGARWHPSGRRVVSAAGSDDERHILELSAEPRGPEARLLAMEGEVETPAWSPDGRHLVFANVTAEQGSEIYTLDPGEGAVPRPLVSSPFDEGHPAFSPDGRWLAYDSNESGNTEVYVQPFGREGRRLQISSAGGAGPVWSRDGREIFFSARGRVMAAAVDGRSELKASVPRELFSGNFVWERVHNFDVGPDGRFVMVQRSSEDRLTEVLRVAVDFGSEVERLVSRGK